MEENETIDGYNGNFAIGKAFEALSKALAVNARMPAEDRDNTVTLVRVDKSPEVIVISGSVQNMHDCFVELFKKRPELRSIVQGVLNEMYQIVSR